MLYRHPQLTLTLLTSTLLAAGCGHLPEAWPLPAPSYALAGQLAIGPDSSRASIEKRFHATVVVWRPDAGFTMLGTSAPKTVTVQALGTTEATFEEGSSWIPGS